MSELIYYDLKRIPTNAPSFATHVANELGRRIVSGVYEQGSLLNAEDSLAERFLVSRSVIRDAVKMLVGKGLLEVRRGSGTRVRPRDQWMLLDTDVLAWNQSTEPNADFLRQLMETRIIFEPKAAHWAAQRATEQEIEEICASFSKMENETGSVESFVIADALFHRSILLAAHNDFLSALDGIIYSALLVSIRLTNQDPRENSDSILFHQKVCDAIAAHEAQQAESAMYELLENANQRLGQRKEEYNQTLASNTSSVASDLELSAQVNQRSKSAKN